MDKNSKKYKAARKAKALEYGKQVRKTNKLRREKDQEREAVLKRENIGAGPVVTGSRNCGETQKWVKARKQNAKPQKGCHSGGRTDRTIHISGDPVCPGDGQPSVQNPGNRLLILAGT
jgi:hypothetical protein